MEQIATELQAITAEVTESRRVLSELARDVQAIADMIEPALLNHIRRLRDARMTVVREIADCLKSLQDIREFFLAKDYTLEMERLARFVEMGREFDRLRTTGVLDALTNCALRLATESHGD